MVSVESDSKLAHSINRRDRLGRFLCIIAILSWVFLMWPLVNAGPLVLDEHGSYWMVDSDLPGTSLERSLNYAAIPPISSWVQMLFLGVLGKSELVFRFSSALCMLGAVVVCYKIGKEFDDGLMGGIAALILTWHPEAMDEVRIARCYGLLMLCGALVVWAAVRWAKRLNSFREASSWMISSIALFWTHYTGAILVAVSGVGVAITCLRSEQFQRTSILRMGFALCGVILGGLPLIPAVLRLSEWGRFLNYSQGSPTIWNVIGLFWWLALPVGLLIAFLISKGKFRKFAARQPFELIAVCALLPLFLIAALLSDELSSLANPRYRVAYAPAGACLAAMLLCQFRSNVGPILGSVTLLVISWCYSPLNPMEMGRLGSHADQNWGELNHYLQETAQPAEPIFVQSGLTEGYLVPAFAEDRLFMEYVACRVSRFYVDSPHPRYALPFLWDSRLGMPEFYLKSIQSWKDSKETTFWVACATDTDLNQNSLAGIQKIAEAAGYRPAISRQWPHAILIQYQKESAVIDE